MAIAQRKGQGGGPRFNDETVRAALIFLGMLMILFFLLVVRLYFDQKAGNKVVLRPQRNPSGVIKAMIDR